MPIMVIDLLYGIPALIVGIAFIIEEVTVWMKLK